MAEQAGVSVGTMYQYFPHKQALLYAVLQWHLAHISAAVEVACQGCRGRPAAEMADGLVNAFLDAKTERLDVTKALYLIAEDLDTTTLLAEATSRNVAATTTMLATAADADFENLLAVASTMFSGIAGSTRIVFERGASSSLFRSCAASCHSCADLICSHSQAMSGSISSTSKVRSITSPIPLGILKSHSMQALASCPLYPR